MLIEVEDRCGGILKGKDDPFKAFADRQARSQRPRPWTLNRTEGVAISGGEIRFRNLPGIGCIFVIDMPLAADTPAITPA